MLEAQLVAQLRLLCPRVYPGSAPAGAALPYVIWQGVGGRPLRYVDNSAASSRQISVQITAWATSLLDALALVQQIEAALCSEASPFLAEPQTEPAHLDESAIGRHGAEQDYDLHGAR